MVTGPRMREQLFELHVDAHRIAALDAFADEHYLD